ncbi:unnamed protein product [Blepharisma stoltei]|uniref:Uncharacterized protein n=1 Tax=Blepharisma stoltei TaxID=1481888 RepID=A0AAU9IM57_9CILI|nr:unnamed protein product [Blepharisma stoltei]
MENSQQQKLQKKAYQLALKKNLHRKNINSEMNFNLLKCRNKVGLKDLKENYDDSNIFKTYSGISSPKCYNEENLGNALKKPLKRQSTAYSGLEKIYKKEISLLESVGLPQEVGYKPEIIGFSKRMERKKSLTISDFWGEKNTKELLSYEHMKDAANVIKFKRYKAEVSAKSSLTTPANPKKMDDNTALRIFIQANSPKFSLSRTEILKSDTPKFTARSYKEIKRADELQILNDIMKECDDLYMENKKTLNALKRRGSFPRGKLSPKNQDKISHHKIWQ